MALLVANGVLVTMNPERAVVSADLLAEDGRITRIAPSIAPPPGARVIDASGQLVLPGFVQAHIHLVQTLLRNQAEGLVLLDWLRERVLPLEAAHDERSVRASADLAIAELLKSGTTAVQDMGTVHHADMLFEAAAAAGIRYVGGKAMMDLGRHAPPRLQESTRASLDESVELARRFHGTLGGRLRYAFAPRFVLSCTEDLLREVGPLARSLGMRLHTHASENPSECEAVRAQAGMDNIEYLEKLGLVGPDVSLAHCVWATPREHEILARTKTNVGHCPSANLKLASGFAPIPEMVREGISVSLGADGAACNNSLDAFIEMRLAALIHRPRVGATGTPSELVLEMATLGGARALGLEHEIGSLEVGKRADLVVMDARGIRFAPGGSPYDRVVLCAHPGDVETVVVDGRVVVEGRRLLTLDEAEVVARATEEGRKVKIRAGLA